MLNDLNQALISTILLVLVIAVILFGFGYIVELEVLKSCAIDNTYHDLFGKEYICYKAEK